MSTLYSVGLMNQLGDALEKAGFTSDDVTALRSYQNLAALKSVVRGHAEIRHVTHVINCDAVPFTPNGWGVADHRKAGQIIWAPEKVRLHLSNNQQNREVVGSGLFEEVAVLPVLNANVLDYLMANPHLIPEKWKSKAVFFWGTVYRRADGLRVVRCLCWNGSRWDWGYYAFDHNWDFSNPAAVWIEESA